MCISIYILHVCVQCFLRHVEVADWFNLCVFCFLAPFSGLVLMIVLVGRSNPF